MSKKIKLSEQGELRKSVRCLGISSDISNQKLLNLTSNMWRDNTIDVSCVSEKLFLEHLSKMSNVEREKYENLPNLAKEFEMLKIKYRIMDGIMFKLEKLTLEELDEWTKLIDAN